MIRMPRSIPWLLTGLLACRLMGAQAGTLIVPNHPLPGCAPVQSGSGNANLASVLAELKTARADLDPKYAGGCRGDALHLLNQAFEAVMTLQEQELQQPGFAAADPREKKRRGAYMQTLNHIHATTVAIDAALKDDREGKQAISVTPLDDAIHALESAFPKP